LVWQHHENPRSVAAYQTVILRTAPVNDRQGSALVAGRCAGPAAASTTSVAGLGS